MLRTPGGVGADSPSFTGPLAVAAGTMTTDVNAISVTQTWNAAGVAFTAVKLNVTNTASAAGALLMDLQIGGFSAFSLSKLPELRIYGLKNGSATEFGSFGWISGSNAYTLTTDATGTGTQRPLLVYANGVYFRPFGIGSTSAQMAHTSSGLDVNAQITASAATATPAGGTAGTGLGLGTAGLRVFWGSGAPSASVPIGSLYLRTDPAGATSRAYIATSAAGAFTNITCAA